MCPLLCSVPPAGKGERDGRLAHELPSAAGGNGKVYVRTSRPTNVMHARTLTALGC